MANLGSNRWGKSEIRISKILAGPEADGFSDVTAQVLLTGDVARAHTEGDNSGVVPTDTMKNTVYGLAQDYLTKDLEAFAATIADHFLAKDVISSAQVTLRENRWTRHNKTGFIGGSSEKRVARVSAGGDGRSISAGVEGLVVLKTKGSAFLGFPRDEFTILPEAADRLLATSITSHWSYASQPVDTTATWEKVRDLIIEHFFGDWSASVQHQGYLMGEAILEAVEEISEVSFHLPNQHHLPFVLSRFGVDDRGVVFHPVSEPYGDIEFTVTR